MDAYSSLSRGLLILKKFSPEIFLGLGILGGVGSAVWACHETLKIDEVRKNNEATLKKIEDGRKEMAIEVYSDEDYKSDLAKANALNMMSYVKLYAKPGLLGLTSIALILQSHGILSKRYTGAVAAYNLVKMSYDAYRDRVLADAGDEKDSYYMHGAKTEVVKSKVLDEKGNEVEIEEEVLTVEDEDPYSKEFNESNFNWRSSFLHNMTFLKAQEKYANQMLHARGHIFLNEVFDSLGIKRTDAGAICGWVEGHGDNCVSFGLNNPINKPKDEENSNNKTIYLDFNVNGVIYKII